MRPGLIAFFVLFFASASALADILPNTAEYLQKIGIDPHSTDLAAVADDTIPLRDGGVASIAELAKQQKSKSEILRFVSTRRFVKAYLQDQRTRLPATDNYNDAYLTDEEKAFVQPAFRRAGDELYLRSLQQGK